jgi:hypothetical protein
MNVIKNADGTRTFQLEKKVEPVKKVTKVQQKRDLAATVGKGWSKKRNAPFKPSTPIITTYED